MSYDVVYYGDPWPKGKHFVAYGCETLAAAAEMRRVSGDLVVFACTDKIVPVTDWLFDWEKRDPNAYASKLVHLAAVRDCLTIEDFF